MSWEYLRTQAVAADRSGADALLVSDHVVFGEHMDDYANPALGGRKGGVQPTGPDGCWLEPTTVLASFIGVTSTIRLGTGIVLAALRRPVVLAKALATLDVLSGGRVDLGVGVGWQREEYTAAGLDFAKRGALLDQSLEICQRLWTSDSATYTSSDIEFTNVHSMPKPAQPGGIPVWVSGRLNDRVLGRIIRFGSGWMPWADYRDGMRADVQRLQEGLAEAGRNPNSVRIMGQLPVLLQASGRPDIAATIDAVRPALDAGITDFRARVKIPEDLDEAVDLLTDFVGQFRGATEHFSVTRAPTE